MKSYSVYFARSAEIESSQSMFTQVESVSNSDWLMCAFRPNDSPPDDEVLFGEDTLTVVKSEELGEIIFLYGDTSLDWFIYEHARGGELLRKLVWSNLPDDPYDLGWVWVEGESEDWERALFNDNNLTQYLENERYQLEFAGKNDEFPSLESEIRQAYDLGKIVQGKAFPLCDGTVAPLVERSYGIMRWDQ